MVTRLVLCFDGTWDRPSPDADPLQRVETNVVRFYDSVLHGTQADGSVQINGVRLGFIHGGLNQVMRESPVRAYDSRSHSHLGGGTSRTVSLANWLPPDAQGAVLALSVLNTHGSGVLQVSAAGSSSEAFAASWARTGDKSTNTLVSDVSLSRAVSVTSVHGSGQTDFVLDLIGWVV